MRSEQKFRGALIGAGKVAQTCHLPAFGDQGICAEAEIVAAADLSDESRRLARERYPALRLYRDAEEMLDREKLDFVDICTTPASHGRFITMAAERGLHILCEKPFCSSLPEAEQIAARLRRSPAVVFMPCHQYRHAPLWRQIKAFREELPQGTAWFLQADVLRTEADPGISGGAVRWRLDPGKSGGGILADTGVHYFYLTHWILGAPLSVQAFTQRLEPGHTVEDTAAVILVYPLGFAEINLTWAGARRENLVRLISNAGVLEYDGDALLLFRGGERQVVRVPTMTDKRQYVALYVALVREFLAALRHGKSPDSWLEEALQSVRLLEACYASATASVPVRLEREA